MMVVCRLNIAELAAAQSFYYFEAVVTKVTGTGEVWLRVDDKYRRQIRHWYANENECLFFSAPDEAQEGFSARVEAKS